MTDDGFKDQLPLIKKAIYAKLPNYAPEDVFVADILCKIPSRDDEKRIACVVAMTDNGHLWLWQVDALMDWYRSFL